MQQQTQMNQNQQPIMQEPPQVITTKDLNYLQDALSWQLMAMKKCSHFANECKDTDISQALDDAGQMHQRHYEMLLTHLENQNMQAMANIPQPSQQQ